MPTAKHEGLRAGDHGHEEVGSAQEARFDRHMLDYSEGRCTHAYRRMPHVNMVEAPILGSSVATIAGLAMRRPGGVRDF